MDERSENSSTPEKRKAIFLKKLRSMKYLEVIESRKLLEEKKQKVFIET